MQNLKVTLVQTEQFWEDKSKNLEHFERLLSEQLHESTDVLIFPEMFHTGFTMNAAPLAEKMDNSLGIGWLRETAKKYNALCLASLIIVENGAFYNRMVAVDDNGVLDYYDKVHLFTLAQEDNYYKEGQNRKIISYKNWKILLQVCYDLRFPESARNAISDNGDFDYDLLVYVANWPERRTAHWDKILPARAIENQCCVVAVNRVGSDNNQLSYVGHSQVLSALGDYYLEPMHNSSGIKTCTLNAEDLLQTREKLPFLKDRKQPFTQ